MHCPSCGQQQVSNETKFCSRCGMPLTVVAEVVAKGGFLPQLEQLGKKKFFSKKNGVVAGIFWFIFFSMFCTSFFAIVGAPEELVAIMAITGVFGAMMILIASVIFLPSSKIKVPFTMPVPAPTPLYGQSQQGALPPEHSQPANQYRTPGAGAWRDTSDLQPSVTESTTRLLSDEERPR